MNESTAINKVLSSSISSVLDKNSKAYFDQLEIGSFIESEGGYYTGLIRSDYDQKLYAIFLAPKGIGDNFCNIMQIHHSCVSIAGTQYLSDGLMNTNALVAFNGTGTTYAGGWSRSLNINGKDDWYLPSRDELEMCYRVFKPTTDVNYTDCYNQTVTKYTASFPTQTSLTDFRTGGTQAFINAWYWSSTQYCADTVGFWVQSVSNGHLDWFYKDTGTYVRAVRRVLVQETL